MRLPSDPELAQLVANKVYSDDGISEDDLIILPENEKICWVEYYIIPDEDR